MNDSILVYGDSIAYGYGNNNQSWFDKLNFSENKYKYAKNGETIENILEKITTDTNYYNTIIIAVGINNLLQESRKAEDFVNLSDVAKYNQILEIAKQKADNVIIQSVLPVIEKGFPKQSWLECPLYAFNITIEAFNKMIKFLSIKHNITYIDAYEVFKTKNLQELYIDAVHLNSKGQKLLLEIYDKLFSNQ